MPKESRGLGVRTTNWIPLRYEHRGSGNLDLVSESNCRSLRDKLAPFGNEQLMVLIFVSCHQIHLYGFPCSAAQSAERVNPSRSAMLIQRAETVRRRS